jgi:hypothetical protein
VKRIVICFGLTLCAGTVLAQGGGADLIRLGGILGENGQFALQDSRITVYSDKTIFLMNGPDKTAHAVDHDGAVSIKVQEGGTRAISTHLPKAQAHWFQLCDTGDQIWSPGVVGMSAILPKGTKIKGIDKLDGHFWLVFATVPTEDWPRITIFLLREDADYNFSLVQSDTVSSRGSFCGTQFMDRDTRVILVNETMGESNSNYSGIYIYQVRMRKPEGSDPAKEPKK